MCCRQKLVVRKHLELGPVRNERRRLLFLLRLTSEHGIASSEPLLFLLCFSEHGLWRLRLYECGFVRDQVVMLSWLYEVTINEQTVVSQLRFRVAHHGLVGIIHELRICAIWRVLLQNLQVNVFDFIGVLPPLLVVEKDALLVLEVSAELVDLEHPPGLPVRE